MKLALLGLLFLLPLSEQQFKMTCKRPTLPNGRIKIRARGKMVHFRCKKRFTRVGAKFAFCMQGTHWTHPPPICIARGCPNVGLLPNLQITESYGGAMMKFQCAVGMKRSGPAVITCDGVKWSDSPPKCIASVKFSCDFEDSSLCGWSQEEGDDFDWIRTSGVTPTMNTGPDFDHTYKEKAHGHYMFIESSSPRNSGDQARLISPLYPAKMSGMCVELWYHMLGPDGEDAVGTLDVYIKPTDVEQLHGLIPQFHISGNQGNQWNRGLFKIKLQKEDFQLVVVGTRKDAFVSDIAIDDIRICNCSEVKTAATTTTMTTTQPLVTTQLTNSTVSTDSNTNTTATQATQPTPQMTTTTPDQFINTTIETTTKSKTVPSTMTKMTTTRTRITTTPPTTTVPLTTQKSTTPIPTLTPTTKKTTTTVQYILKSTITSSTTMSTIAPTKKRITTTSSTPKPTRTTTLSTTKRQTTIPPPTTTISSTTSGKQKSEFSTRHFITNGTSITVQSSTQTSRGTDRFQNATRTNNGTREFTTTTPSTTSTNKSVVSSEVYNATAVSETTVSPSWKTTNDSNEIPNESPNERANTTLSNNIVPTISVKVGQSKSGKHLRSLIPLIIGISCGIVVGMVAIGILAFLWTRHQRRKKAQELEDEMLFISTSEGYYAPS